MSEKLADCPFCQGPVTLVEKGNLIVFLCEPSSPCVGSGLGNYGLASKRDSVIATWNRRHQDQSNQSEFERMLSK